MAKKKAKKKVKKKAIKLKKKSGAKARAKAKAGAKAKGKAKGKSSLKVAYLALGSNIGDREAYVTQALDALRQTPGIKVKRVSTVRETAPEKGVDQPLFLNAAVEVETSLSPEELLKVTQDIESALGRQRGKDWEPGGPRTIDIDILMYEDVITSTDELQIPHPLLHERSFVLEPLCEIAPLAIHPVLGLTIEELCEEYNRSLGEIHEQDQELRKDFKRIREGFVDDYERT